jgi:hypothetical protein
VSVNSANNSTGGSGYVPSAVSSLFGRQKIAQWWAVQKAIIFANPYLGEAKSMLHNRICPQSATNQQEISHKAIMSHL